MLKIGSGLSLHGTDIIKERAERAKKQVFPIPFAPLPALHTHKRMIHDPRGLTPSRIPEVNVAPPRLWGKRVRPRVTAKAKIGAGRDGAGQDRETGPGDC